MEIGFPLKESSILLKHASARGAEPVAPTEAPHHGHGAATRRRGVEPVVPPEAPQQRPGRRQQLRNLYRGIGDRTIFSNFLQAGVYFFFNYGIAICADSRLSGFAKNLGFSTSLKNIVEKIIVEKSVHIFQHSSKCILKHSSKSQKKHKRSLARPAQKRKKTQKKCALRFTLDLGGRGRGAFLSTVKEFVNVVRRVGLRRSAAS